MVSVCLTILFMMPDEAWSPINRDHHSNKTEKCFTALLQEKDCSWRGSSSVVLTATSCALMSRRTAAVP